MPSGEEEAVGDDGGAALEGVEEEEVLEDGHLPGPGERLRLLPPNDELRLHRRLPASGSGCKVAFDEAQDLAVSGALFAV